MSNNPRFLSKNSKNDGRMYVCTQSSTGNRGLTCVPVETNTAKTEIKSSNNAVRPKSKPTPPSAVVRSSTPKKSTMVKHAQSASPSQIGAIKTQQNRLYLQPVHVALTKYGKLLVIAGSGNDDKGLNFQASLVDPRFKIHEEGPAHVKYQHQSLRDYTFRNQITVQYQTNPPHPLAVVKPNDPANPHDVFFDSDNMPPSIKGLGYDMFGNGFGVQEDCMVLIVSGVEIFDIFKATTRCSYFNPETEEFEHAPTLRQGRWYPTCTTLPSGHIFTIGGIKGTKNSIRYNSTNNTNTDIYDPYATCKDRGDNLIDPVTMDYRKDVNGNLKYPTQAETRDDMRNGGDTARLAMKGMWMTHSLAELGRRGPTWPVNDQNVDLNGAGVFVPAPYQAHQINSAIFGNIATAADPQVSFHGRGLELTGAADGNNYDDPAKDYSPLHNDIFSAIPVAIRDSHLLHDTPLFQSAVAEDAEQPRVDMYPRQFLLKDGNVFIAGWEKESWVYHPSVNKYDNHQDTNSDKRLFGTAVLLPLRHDDDFRERVFILGGLPSYNRNIPADNTTEIIDLSRFETQDRTLSKYATDGFGNLLWQQWHYGPSFNQPCFNLPAGDNGEMVQQNATILPNGDVFIQGGERIDEIGKVARLTTFLYTPPGPGDLNDPTVRAAEIAANGSLGVLRRGPDVRVPRDYHGTTLLLPDGTVGIYGGNAIRGNFERDIEVYEPAYLFDQHGNRIPDNKRPKITNLKNSPSVKLSGYDAHGDYVHEWLSVQLLCLKENQTVTASIVRLGAVTHAFNSEQRMCTCPVRRNCGPNKVEVQMPDFFFEGYNSGHHHDTFVPCPPGCYMLFLCVDGVMSRSRIIRLIRQSGDVPITHGPGGSGHGGH